MGVADKLDATAERLARLPERLIREAVGDLKRVTEQAIERDTGGDAVLSGTRSRKRIVVQTRVTGTRGRTVRGTVQPRKAQRGMVVWLDTGTAPRAQGRGRHPGTRGKRTWDTPVDRTLPEVAERLRVAWWQTVTRTF